jgi:P27 family predicted phage terminase small subunit
MKGRKPKLSVIECGKVSGRCPVAPSWLTSQAKAEWKRAAPELHARGLLLPDTLATLEAYCVATGTVRECEEIMMRDGRMITVDGVAKPHQAFKMQTAAMREARLLAAELGLTPHRRCAGGKDQKEKADGWDADLLA